MLETLSRHERIAIKQYDRQVACGDVDNTPIWVDGFSSYIYSRVPKGAPVIDVGCGTGRFIPLLLPLGITNYHGVDPSEKSVEYCQRTFPEHSFAVGELRTIGEEYPDQFSGFILTAVLMHVPPKELGRAIASLRASLKKGAHGLVSTPLPISENGYKKFWRNSAGMRLSLYTQEEIVTAFSENGFIVSQIFSPDEHMILAHMVAN